MATLLKIDGTTKEVQPRNKKHGFTLDELYSLLDCSLIEAVGPMDDGRLMICDEEGKLKEGWGERINALATHEYRVKYGPIDVIVGNALLVNNKEFK